MPDLRHFGILHQRLLPRRNRPRTFLRAQNILSPRRLRSTGGRFRFDRSLRHFGFFLFAPLYL